MSVKNKLTKEVWERSEYYQIAKKGLEESSHEDMRILRRISSGVSSILDLGCGEGTRLSQLSGNSQLTGIDISQTAINMAKKNYPKLNFIKADLENIPLKNKSFDLVYSAYVLEHLSNPKKVLLEAIRVLKNKGTLVLIAPNYGAPNRSSPPFKGNRIKKIILGFIGDLLIFFRSNNSLEWSEVAPIANSTTYDVDWDTTIEPYANSLSKFLINHQIKIEYLTTCWSEELSNAKIHQWIFRLLGKAKIYPFPMWGPHLIVVGKKYEN